MSAVQTILTGSGFGSEENVLLQFDRIVTDCNAFRLLKEVPGEYTHPRPDTEEKGGKIDRILMPTRKAMEAGWHEGAIGIEAKASGKKYGKPACQAIDYTRCVFEIKEWGGILVMLKWVFIVPEPDEPLKGALESILAQNRIGGVSIGKGVVRLSCGGTGGIVMRSDGTIEVKPLPMGKKRGNRG